MQTDIQNASRILKEKDYIVILCHQKPDGDALGSAFALLYALEAIGKTARVESPDGFPPRYDFLYGAYVPKEFDPQFVVTVDVAGLQLLGRLGEKYAQCIDLCIDHHVSNNLPAKSTVLAPQAAATAQMVYRIILELDIPVSLPIANAVFTGISTDTGCFKYENVTAETHRIAAEVIEAGAQHAMINHLMFDSLSPARMAMDSKVMETLEYHFDGVCAVITIPAELPVRYGVTEEEMDGLSARPRRIQGVKAGVTLREKEDGSYRISLRTGCGINASRICGELGGGGHKNAAGCTVVGSLDSVKQTVLEAIQRELERMDKE